MIRIALAALAAAGLVSIASTTSAEPAPSSGLHARAVAALPLVRQTLRDNLSDVRVTQFRNVHARLTRSVYSTDDGHHDRVPHHARGGVVLVFCGEILDVDGYGRTHGWHRFYVEPAQADIVVINDFRHPGRGHRENRAANNGWGVTGFLPGEDVRVRLQCAAPAAGDHVDAVDMSRDMAPG